jgi:hypothetical protein
MNKGKHELTEKRVRKIAWRVAKSFPEWYDTRPVMGKSHGFRVGVKYMKNAIIAELNEKGETK